MSNATLKLGPFFAALIPSKISLRMGVCRQSSFGVVVTEPKLGELLSKHSGPNAAIPIEANVSGWSLINAHSFPIVSAGFVV